MCIFITRAISTVVSGGPPPGSTARRGHMALCGNGSIKLGRGEGVLRAKQHQSADGDALFAPRAAAGHQQSSEDAM